MMSCQNGSSGALKNRLTLELRDVLAARSKLGLSFKSTGVEISVKNSTDFADALRNASAMMVGCMPFWSIFSAAPSKLPARTTTEVVPSPASMSCAADRSTSCTIIIVRADIESAAQWITHHLCGGVKGLNAS